MYKQTYSKNINQIDILRQEVNMLRSLVIGTIGEDREGGYNLEFLKKIFRASRGKPLFRFKDEKSFLKQID